MKNRRHDIFQSPGLSSIFFVVGLFVLSVSAGHALEGVPPDVLTVLQQIKSADKDQLAVSEEDGRFLRVMVVSSGAKRALEIGAADGYSAIWIGLGCAKRAASW